MTMLSSLPPVHFSDQSPNPQTPFLLLPFWPSLMDVSKLFNLAFAPLFQAANKIKVLEDMDKLDQLATLHLRDNQIESLSGFTAGLKNLQYINFRGNNIQALRDEVSKLEILPKLRAVVFAGKHLFWTRKFYEVFKRLCFFFST